MIRQIFSATFFLLILSPSAFAQVESAPRQPRDSYALHLQARPAAPFPFLDKLGNIEIQVYPQGVRADSLWLDGYLLAESDSVRIENPAVRLYTDASFEALRKLFSKLRPEDAEPLSLEKLEVIHTGKTGTIMKLPVSCHRVVLGKKAWIDVWSTPALRTSPAWERLQVELLSAISPELSKVVKEIPGTVVHVMLNTEHFPKTVLLTTTEVYLSSAGHEEALQTGRFFLRAPSLDRLVQ